MDSTEEAVNIQVADTSFEWKERIRIFLRWALACPPEVIKEKDSIFSFGESSAEIEPEPILSWWEIITYDTYTIVMTIAIACLILYVLDYFFQFCFSLGIILSGKDNVGSTMSSPAETPVKQRSLTNTNPVRAMNEPRKCLYSKLSPKTAATQRSCSTDSSQSSTVTQDSGNSQRSSQTASLLSQTRVERESDPEYWRSDSTQATNSASLAPIERSGMSPAISPSPAHSVRSASSSRLNTAVSPATSQKSRVSPVKPPTSDSEDSLDSSPSDSPSGLPAGTSPGRYAAGNSPTTMNTSEIDSKNGDSEKEEARWDEESVLSTSIDSIRLETEFSSGEDSDEKELLVYGDPFTGDSGNIQLRKQEYVEFVWKDSEEKKVSITGTFFGWELELPLNWNGDYFTLNIELPPGSYAFKFLVKNE